MATKSAVIHALTKFSRQRPGLDFGNYGDIRAYNAEARSIQRDLRDAKVMLQAVEWRESISGDAIIEAAKHAFSGRLSLTARDDGTVSTDYCTGQYWPTEYRRAVCAVLASVLWDYWRNDGASTGDAIRKAARDNLGRGIAGRWFR